MINIETIVILEPRKKPEVRQLQELTLKVMQKIVEGNIQVVDCGHNILMVCNEEGKLENKEPNFILGDDVIAGITFFCKSKGSEMVGLTEFQTKVIMEMFNDARK